jgi:DNA-binding CsgD family transcriptional regulator
VDSNSHGLRDGEVGHSATSHGTKEVFDARCPLAATPHGATTVVVLARVLACDHQDPVGFGSPESSRWSSTPDANHDRADPKGVHIVSAITSLRAPGTAFGAALNRAVAVDPSPDALKPMTSPLLRPTAVRGAPQRVIAGRPTGAPVRAEILESWRRAVNSGLRPDRIDATFAPVDGHDEPLAQAAGAVTAALGDDLAGTNLSILVADAHGRIVRRRAADQGAADSLDAMHLSPGFMWTEEHVGTNGIGTALYRRTATLVAGDEHFADRLTSTCCAGAPIVEDGSGRIRGVIAIVGNAADATDLMTTVARQAARDIERHLRTQISRRQQLLREKFAMARRHTRSAVAVVSPDTLLINASAARLLSPDDRNSLWEWASHEVCRAGPHRPLRLASGAAIEATVTAVHAGGELVGALVHILNGQRDAPTPAPRSRPPSSAARFGWPSLTDAELGVAVRVAAGLSNREVGVELCLSPHTVDSHLRHIYTKLGIASRVQLTRLVICNGERFDSHHARAAHGP